MKAVVTVGLGLFVVSVLALAGCRHHPDSVVVVREGPPPREVVVEDQPEAVVVEEAPPPMVVEEYGPAPGPGYVWMGGFYSYHGHHYVWTRGSWGRPPHPGARWEPHRWVRERDGRHHYYAGHWR